MKTPRPLQAHPTGGSAHEIRIIGGQWKRTKLKVIDRPGLRPTPDRVRETLFNWLGQDLSGWRCVDAFAGTGALGFEAASRGGRLVYVLEQDKALVAQLENVKLQLNAEAVHVLRTDGVNFLLLQPPASLHLVLLDPPFDSTLFEPALAAAARAAMADGYVYLEAPMKWADEALAALGLQLYRYLRAGAVHAHLLRPALS